MNRRLAIVLMRTCTQKNDITSNLELTKDRNLYDYMGHKYSYDKEKNYGAWSNEELWGQKYGYVDTVEMRKEKIRDNWVTVALFFSCVGFVIFSASTSNRMLSSFKQRNEKSRAALLTN